MTDEGRTAARSTSTALAELRARLADIHALSMARDVLSWDQNTYMPEAGARDRGRHMAVLHRLAHETFVAERTGELLDAVAAETRGLPHEHPDVRLVEVVRRDYQRHRRVPAGFLERLGVHAAATFQAWQEARPADDFAKVADLLEATLDLSREFSTFFPGADHPADPHIDLVDDGFSVATLRPLFATLRAALVPLAEAVAGAGSTEPSPFTKHFDQHEQVRLALAMAQRFGYDLRRGRLDLAPHPFATSFGRDDVRITTRVRANDLTESLFSTLHETGHALYELGIGSAWDATPLARGASSGVHESQSRLWENLVGRSAAFWRWAAPVVAERFPAQLAGVSHEQCYRAVNRVRPSLIRTDADEVTYNLHVVIRFELELELLEGALTVAELPDAWRERYQAYLGVAPVGDADGVLQDIHWYAGMFGGSFQGYTIGNVLSVPIFEAAQRDLGDLGDDFADGVFDRLHAWLRRELYRHGRSLQPLELVELVTGAPLTVEPYLDYLSTKYADLYGI